jgi:hypothetical protein
MTDKPKCGAVRNGRTCSRPAGWGTDHPGVGACKLHAGCTPAANKAASKELARRECARLGIPVEVDPGDALMAMLWEAYGNVAFYRSLVEELPTHPDPDVFVPADSEDGQGHWERGDVGIYGRTYHIYNEERDRAKGLAEAAIRAGIEERRVRLAERQGDAVNQLIRGILGELGVLDRPETPGVVRKHLALIAAGT